MRMSIWMAAIVIVAATLGCQQQPAGPSTEELAAQKVEQAMSAGTGGSPIAGATDKVEVAEEGTRFDPPVQVAQMPSGVWYCDMGTVHYARASEGDGRCAVCGMTLSESP